MAAESQNPGGHAAVLWQTLRLLLACAASYAMAWLLGLKEEYWALITAVVVSQPALDDTLIASRNRVAGTLIGAAAGFLVIEAARQGLPRLPLFWCTLIPLALLTAVRQSLRLSCVTLIVVVLIPSTGSPFERPVDRVFGILIGTLASIVVTAVIRNPWRSRDGGAAPPDRSPA